MPDNTLAISVAEAGRIEPARRAAIALAQRVGFDEPGATNAGLVAARLAGSLVEHSAQGTLLVSVLPRGDVAGLKLIAIGGAGEHAETLAAIAPMVETCDSYSAPGQTAALVARLWPGTPPADDLSAAFEFGGICVPVQGETKCGDGWWAESSHDRALIVLVDGVGHGPIAHEAAQKALEIARAHRDRTPYDLMARIHEGLHQTRGAAVLVVAIDLARQILVCCGVGNIAGMIVTPSHVRGLVSQHGTAGMNKVRIQEFRYPFPADALLVLHSDGLKTAWNFSSYPGLEKREPCLIAAVLYRDFVRGRDDTTVVVLRGRRGSPQAIRGDP
jgi:hypothetical protein